VSPQSEIRKIRPRRRSYERKLHREKKKYGFFRDAGPLPLLEPDTFRPLSTRSTTRRRNSGA
jgi:hypothetical protein